MSDIINDMNQTPAETINNIKNHVSNAYNSLNYAGAIIPQQKNIANLSATINSIGQRPIPEDPKTFKEIRDLTLQGQAQTKFKVRDQLIASELSSASIAIESTTISSATIDSQTFIEKIGIIEEMSFGFSYSNGEWRFLKDDSKIDLIDYGISIVGVPGEGDQLAVKITSKDLTFDIVDFNKETSINVSPTSENSINLLMHDIYTYGTIPFSASQLMFAVANKPLPAGNYKFTLKNACYGSTSTYDGTYIFTTTKQIPVGGGFRHTNPIGGWKSSYSKSDVIGNYITTYSAVNEEDGATGATIQSGLNVKEYVASEWSGKEIIDLGQFTAQNRSYYIGDGETKENNIDTKGDDETNLSYGAAITKDVNGDIIGYRNFTERQAYGSNRWKHSVYRQWLNSKEPAASGTKLSTWWKRWTIFDRVPSGYRLTGFMHGKDPDFINNLGTTSIKTALYSTDKVNGDEMYDETADKFFLASQNNTFGSTSILEEGQQWEYFSNVPSGITSNDNRIKYQNSTAKYWWLRTAFSSFSSYVRYVNASGGLSYDGAYDLLGVVPACTIS